MKCKGSDCCGGMVIENDKHMASMDLFRSELGIPFRITSWCRCPKHNDLVDGVEGSNHTRGCATDGIPVPPRNSPLAFMNMEQLLSYCKMIAEKVGFEEIIVYDDFIHLGSE
jgi:hypothetical protein